VSVTLLPVHLQRLRLAVVAAQSGAEVRFRMNHGEPSKVVWWRVDRPCVQHPVCNSFGAIAPWYQAVMSEYERMRNERQ
jgi:hypothetical protein